MKKTVQNKNTTPNDLCSSNDGAAVRELMSRIGDKWSIFLVVALSSMPGRRARFSVLERTIPGISQRMLTATLRNLERDGMLSREVFPEIPPRVEYELTELGLSLLKPMQALIDWTANHWSGVKKAREKFDSKR